MLPYLKSSFYSGFPALWAHLLTGAGVGCDDEIVPTEARGEIAEDGGYIWWCKKCGHVCSFNRPCEHEGDQPRFGVPPTKEELMAWAEEDRLADAQDDPGEVHPRKRGHIRP